VLGIVEQNLPNLSTFIADDPRGKHLPNYLIEAGKVLNQERETVMEKVASLTKKIDHIKDIVATQQSYAGSSGMAQPVSVAELMEDAVQINSASLERHQIVVERNYSELPEVTLDKQKLLQILINLVANAKQAVQENTSVHGHIELIVKRDDDDFQLEVVDNGVGILQENLDRIFRHGFTTKQGGHGFGLHSAALAAKEMGGSLTVESEGRGSGARFKLRLPLRTEAAAVA
ncbi:MAG: HAMP domain-containing sensor histidine kinase, partial [Pirellulaceae bacterium]|jgi:signal transduction histidine kinase|nr:HAMP domain-containing sensor histidine kinase [Pirellulaceae bacterium]